jgi:hypothetical protein
MFSRLLMIRILEARSSVIQARLQGRTVRVMLIVAFNVESVVAEIALQLIELSQTNRHTPMPM